MAKMRIRDVELFVEVVGSGRPSPRRCMAGRERTTGL